MRKNEEGSRPRIKLILSSHDYVVEFLGLAFLIILIGIPVYYYNLLPDRIPTHFNAAGTPDGFGSRSSLFILPATGFFMYLLLTVIQRLPHIYNFPVKITLENAEVQYRLATRMIRVLKTVILFLFTFISWMTIRTATGNAKGLGKAFLPVFLILTFGVVIIYLVQSLNNRDHA